ncbi:Serine phosphatase RsbU, regulator of sigma subunit [Actinacidiphila yanglinensis]|uniref:Serine phosphatase RsbU, regulator of sigma subunit n=1 Tax=Actinacidiphila yanglinensis TaxID=310779 RepID=A0A1H6DBU7_9ACTN|nr:PP2C family protein-serine/threonine phosphatase [Actinacidiphila yanglinensis]SEG82758.1 Serine phosphatase RsbU, regulator of sigma subunit [Actinacidiphila yanglinensis]
MSRLLRATQSPAGEPTDGDGNTGIGAPRTRSVVLATVASTVVALALVLLTNTAVLLLGLLVFLPAFAAALCTPRQTALISAWVCAIVIVPVALQSGQRILDRVVLSLFAVAFGALAVYAARARIRREGELVRLRSTAAAMQRQILRPLPILTDEVLVDGVYEPLQEDKLVGGDIYDVAATPWGTRVLIGDVQGKGLPAIGMAIDVVGAFREAAHREPTVTALVDALEAAVVRHNEDAGESGEPERFVTALVLGVSTAVEIQVVSCGHIPPYLLHAGTVIPVGAGEEQVPLGLAKLIDEPRTVSGVTFPAGATLLLCTDGLTEARSPEGAFYPLEARLTGRRDIAADRLTRSLVDEVRVFTAGAQQDDLAVLAVRRSADQAP